ncbi:type IV pilin protein [Stutzerimonas stutzeri]|uniref:type IV pilin protein n=1 Tax=Stutzerimonas stutzeri TaxID=316 RepID=UPI00210CC6E8|nr:type IV pilin protein [Stutzerimonas stutzeri]MCQ4322068.1 type IV pilin protein [Stutzerimonas stutzeri]
MKKLRSPRQGGFTLIELMIVVAIIGVLAAIVFPSYQEHVRKARRADAQASLFELAQFMERQYTANGTYELSDTTLLPYDEAPRDGATKFYDLAFKNEEPTASTFVLTATPKNGMTDDRCGTLSLSNIGAKESTGDAAVTDCWKQ